MTACVNKKHSRRVAAAVSASLVGALTLGAAPAIVMAEEAPVDTQFVTEEGAFNGAEVQYITFKHGNLGNDMHYDSTDKVWYTEYDRNQPGHPRRHPAQAHRHHPAHRRHHPRRRPRTTSST